jgi:hypothetical protein
MPKAEPHQARDWMVEDACDNQRAKGELPTPHENSKYLEGVLNRMDRKKSDSKPRTPLKSNKKPGAFERELDRRAEQNGFEVKGDWEVTEKAAELPITAPAQQLSWADQCMLKRLQLLKSLPDWHVKFKRVNPRASMGFLGPDKKREADAMLWKIVHESVGVFGEWLQPKPTPKPISYAGQDKR